MRKVSVIVTAAAAIAILMSSAMAELPSNEPPDVDMQLLTQRELEVGCDTSTTPPTCPAASANQFDSGIFDVPVPDSKTKYKPARRVPRDRFGIVGPFNLSKGLQPQDLDALVYPGTTKKEKDALVQGMTFFTMFHTPGEGGAPSDNGVGPLNNQPACIGCHLNATEAVKGSGLLQGQGCTTPGSSCTNVSSVTRAARSTPTNFQFTSLDPQTGGGRATDSLDALNFTGKTAAFTKMGNFSPTLTDNGAGPPGTSLSGSIGCLDPIDGASHSCLNGTTTQPLPVQAFGGGVQHVRPLGPDCVPKPLAPLGFDKDLPNGNSGNPNDFYRAVGERAGPPYIGRGLMEAVPTSDIMLFNRNQAAENGVSFLPVDKHLKCDGGCISGKANMIPRTFARNTSGLNTGTDTGTVGGVGRFGLRANGVEILQFTIGGLQGELSFTSLFNPAEINFPTLFPGGMNTTPPTQEPQACFAALSEKFGQPVDLNTLEVHLSELFSERNFIRNTSLPDFGDALLDVLEDALKPNPEKSRHGDSKKERDASVVKRGAELFGIDLAEFAKRTINNRATAATDGLQDNAIASDRKLNCVGCHTPIRRTGQSPAGLTTSGVGDKNLSFKWAPIFSDQLLHHMPVITGERQTTNGLPRDVVMITRSSLPKFSYKGDEGDDRGDDDGGRGKGSKVIFDTFDLPRNLADDVFSNLKATAEGSEFRTAPLMGLGRIGPPFLHDGRVYLSKDTVDKTPAGTVTTNRDVTNAPLVVRTVDDAILAAIELHDLPAPDDKNKLKTLGAGCPVPPGGPDATNVDYTGNGATKPEDVICPAYKSATSQNNRSDAREVIYRFRQLSSADQQAVIEFLKQL